MAAGVAGIVAGFATGFAIGREPVDPLAGARSVSSELSRAAASLEVAAIEYREALTEPGGVQEAEYEGALDALASSRRRFTDVRAALEVLMSNYAQQIAAAYDALETAMRDRADVEDVDRLIEDLRALLSDG